VLFRADRAEDCPALNADHSLGWRDMFGKGLEIIQVTGDHTTMLREHPHDENLARLLSDAVARHCAKPAPLIAPSA
jgi:thioesterase domain-containing protein